VIRVGDSLKLAQVGVIHGRFQPVHLGHMEYLLAGKQRCKFLLIGITNSDPTQTAPDSTNPARSAVAANPLTYLERLFMLGAVMVEAGVPRKEFEIIPFPINFPRLLRFYAPEDALYFVTVYDSWGRAKLDTLKSLGLKTEVMWERRMSERLTTGTEVRKLIATGGEWEQLVPSCVAKMVDELDLARRIAVLLDETSEPDV